MITDPATRTIPAQQLCDLIMAAADTPGSPVMIVRMDSWGLGVRSIRGIRTANDGTVELEVT